MKLPRAVLALGFALALAAPALAQVPSTLDQATDTLEKLARENFGELSAAERILVCGAPHRALPSAAGENTADDPKKAAQWGPDRTIRAALLAWLVSDPKAAPYIHPSGAGIIGARIAGLLDLSYLEVARPLTLVRCVIHNGVDFSNGSIQSLDLRDSITGPITGDLARVKQDLSLGFGSYGPVSLYRASIGGNLDCTGGTFASSNGESVMAVDSTIDGDALFHQDFTTDGTVDFRLAKIGHSLSFNHAHFRGTGGNGLDAERAAMTGSLYWIAVDHTAHTVLDLQNARVYALWDDTASWPAPGNLSLDGFEYQGFGADSPANAGARLRWLALEPHGYHPQPYVQLANVLRQMGRSQGETEVLIAQRVAQRKYGSLTIPQRGWNLLLEATIGYGYRPLRALWWMLAFVAIGTIMFGWGYRAGVMAPTDAGAYWVQARDGAPPPHYPRFNAFVYSLETFVPLMDLHQGAHWRPGWCRLARSSSAGGQSHTGDTDDRSRLGIVLRWYLWVHIMAGWILTPLMFAGLSGLIRVE